MVTSPQVSWLFFKARAKRPYLSHTGRASTAEKQPTGPGPEGCDENGPAAALLVGHVSVQICSLLPPVRLGPPCRRPILITTKYLVFRGQDTSRSSQQKRCSVSCRYHDRCGCCRVAFLASATDNADFNRLMIVVYGNGEYLVVCRPM